MESDLIEANCALTAKLDRLIDFLKVCPQCLNGYLKDEEYHPMTARVTDTWSETIELHCSNKLCSHSIKKPNPDYKPRVSVGQKTPRLSAEREKELNDQFEDLFG